MAAKPPRRRLQSTLGAPHAQSFDAFLDYHLGDYFDLQSATRNGYRFPCLAVVDAGDKERVAAPELRPVNPVRYCLDLHRSQLVLLR